jgi:integrase
MNTKKSIKKSMTVADAVTAYMEANRLNDKKRVRTSFCSLCASVGRKLEQSKTDKIALTKFDAKALAKYDGYLLRNCSENTRLQYYNALKAVFAWLGRQIDLTSPFDAVAKSERPKAIKRTEIKYLQPHEVEALKGCADLTNEVQRAFLFSYFTGLRLSDIKTLTADTIKTMADGSKAVVIKTQKTGTRVFIPLQAEAVELMEGKTKGKYLFRLPEYRQTIERELEKWRILADVDTHITFHVARHTFATQLVRKGVRIEVISKLLGHTNLTTTQIYAEIDEFTINNELKNVSL